MVPEIKLIIPEYVDRQQQRFDAAAQGFGEIYARGQNMFFVGRDLLSRIAGRRTHSEEIIEAIANLQEARLNLTEVRARQAAQTAPDDLVYRQELSAHFAREYYVTGQEALTAARIENSNLGAVDDVFRVYIRPDGTAFKLLTGGVLMLAASGGAGFIQGENAATTREIATFFLTTGGLNLARQIFLNSFSRSRVNISTASTASLIRRRASIHEGQITGDETESSQSIDAALQPRLGEEILNQLQLNGINRPDFTNPADMSDILRQRESLRSRVSAYVDLPALERSRNIARFSRLTRTLLVAGVAAFLISGHIQRPEYCGSRTFPQPDVVMQTATGGAIDISSLRGMAQNEWFKSIYGRDFNPKDPNDQTRFDKARKYDSVTYAKLIKAIGDRIREKNPQVTFIGDFVKQGTVQNLCPAELQDIYTTTH